MNEAQCSAATQPAAALLRGGGASTGGCHPAASSAVHCLHLPPPSQPASKGQAAEGRGREGGGGRGMGSGLPQPQCC